MPKSHICRFGIYFEHPFLVARKTKVQKAHSIKYNFYSFKLDIFPERRLAALASFLKCFLKENKVEVNSNITFCRVYTITSII